MTKLAAPDLTSRPPRSPRVRLGGYVHLPRLLDKARATLAGINGDYNYDCPMDQHFFAFTGLKATDLLRQVKSGKSDGALLKWVNANSKPRHAPLAIAAWSAWMEQRAPGNVDQRDWFNDLQRKLAPERDDIATWFDLFDLDDCASFGGKP